MIETNDYGVIIVSDVKRLRLDVDTESFKDVLSVMTDDGQVIAIKLNARKLGKEVTKYLKEKR